MASSKLNYMMYADDTTLYFNLEDFDCRNMDNEFNSEIENINLWLKLNKLSLNDDKTKYMIFHTNQRMIQPQVSIIMLDSKILWTSHTNLVCMKLSKTMGIIKRLKYTFPNKKVIFSIQFTIYPIHTIWLIIMGI